MTQMFRTLLLALGASLTAVTAAQAACVVEYKAKRDNPLELFYDVAQVGGDCTFETATEKLQKKLAKEGLTLLKVLSVTKE